jgi:hypothetical protein
MPDLSVVADQLVAAARRRGVELTGPGGLLTGLTKQVLKTALEAPSNSKPPSPKPKPAWVAAECDKDVLPSKTYFPSRLGGSSHPPRPANFGSAGQQPRRNEQ